MPSTRPVTRKRVPIRYEKTNPLAIEPDYKKPGDANLTLYSVEALTIPAGAKRRVSTGIKLDLPLGVEAQIRSIKNLAFQKGITVFNAPETIDENNKNEVVVLLSNDSKDPFPVTVGMAIAELVVSAYLIANLRER